MTVAQTRQRITSLSWLILCVNLSGLKDAQMTKHTSGYACDSVSGRDKHWNQWSKVDHSQQCKWL